MCGIYFHIIISWNYEYFLFKFYQPNLVCVPYVLHTDCIYVMKMLLYVTVATFARRANPSVFKQKKRDVSLNPTRDKYALLFSLCVIYRQQLAMNNYKISVKTQHIISILCCVLTGIL